MSFWSQFFRLGVAQQAVPVSLCEEACILNTQTGKLNHLDCGDVNRSSSTRLNEQQPDGLHEGLLGMWLSRCKAFGPEHHSRFKHKQHSLDAVTFQLPASTSD